MISPPTIVGATKERRVSGRIMHSCVFETTEQRRPPQPIRGGMGRASAHDFDTLDC